MRKKQEKERERTLGAVASIIEKNTLARGERKNKKEEKKKKYNTKNKKKKNKRMKEMRR